jgi:hypothetical protein
MEEEKEGLHFILRNPQFSKEIFQNKDRMLNFEVLRE